jgi:hypothetical protein
MRHTGDSSAEQLDRTVLELGRIFAEGALRAHRLGHLPPNAHGLSLETALETARQDLEQSRKTRLSVTRG